MELKSFGRRTVFAAADSKILESINYFEPVILSASFYKVNDNVFYLKPTSTTYTFIYLVKARWVRIETTQEEACIFRDRSSWGYDIMGIITDITKVPDRLIIGVWERYDENSELEEYTFVVSKNDLKIRKYYVDLYSYLSLLSIEQES